MASFASPSDMVIYYDQRKLAQEVSDSGTPAADLDNNTVLLTLLARATEEILAHALTGKKYTEDELQALADSETSGYYLVGLCCDLAFGYLMIRRGKSITEVERVAPNYKIAQLKLLQLADGSEIFPRLDDANAHADAGTPSTIDLTNQTTSPCLYSGLAYRRLLPSRGDGRYGGACGGNC